MERKLLQIVVAPADFTAVGFGLDGVLFGTTLVGLSEAGVIDSSVRFLKGMTLMIGLVGGTLARLMAVVRRSVPTVGILFGPTGELRFVPLLRLWQCLVAGVARPTAIT